MAKEKTPTEVADDYFESIRLTLADEAMSVEARISTARDVLREFAAVVYKRSRKDYYDLLVDRMKQFI